MIDAKHIRKLAAKRASSYIVVALAAALLCMALPSCARSDSGEPAEPLPESEPHALSGDSALPELDGDYAYLLAEVTAKDPGADSIEVEVVSWQVDGPFIKSGIMPGESGTVDCSELGIYPAGIQEGTVVAIASPAADADAFPITAHSIEKSDWFAERIGRQSDSR